MYELIDEQLEFVVGGGNGNGNGSHDFNGNGSNNFSGNFSHDGNGNDSGNGSGNTIASNNLIISHAGVFGSPINSGNGNTGSFVFVA
jgi:hypothetical protein